MVLGYPEIYIARSQGYQQSSPSNEQIWGVCVECTKGEPFSPELVTTPSQLLADFGIRLDGFFGVGGQALYVVRVTAGTPVAAVQNLLDDAATGVKVLTLTAQAKGSYEIVVNAEENLAGGSNLTISTDALPTEFYLGVQTITELAARINANSQIVTATLVTEGSGVLATVNDLVVGDGGQPGDVAGSDGTVKGGSTTGELASGDAPAAHDTGLNALSNYEMNGVFSISQYATVQDKYVIHAQDMSSPTNHKWRYASVGAAVDDTAMADILARTATATGYDEERVLFVGQGLIDRSGNEYPSYEATQAVAGKRSALWYGLSIWGGETSKLLGVSGENFFVDLMPMPGTGVGNIATLENFREYNEKGVITFYRDVDGVRIREGVTTVQPGNTSGAEDEEAVVSVVTQAMRNIYAAAKSMLGKNITNSYKTDLEQKIVSALEEMKIQDQTIIDLPDEGIKAYSIGVTLVPRSTQIEGKVHIAATITPVHCAREIRADVVIL